MGNIINTAPCRFCGQMVQIDSEEKLTEPQAEEKATMSCTCEQAVEYQKEKQRKEKAMQNVAALFGEAAAPEKRCSEGIVNILKAAVEEIYTGGLAKVTLNLRGGVKASISQNKQRRDKRRAYRDQKAEINRIGERVRVTEREICGSFRRAENQKQQIQILTELTCKNKYQIIGILLRNGEKVPKSIENQLYKRLDALDAQIFECEMEHKEIVTALTGENRRKEHGNRIQRHGRTE